MKGNNKINSQNQLEEFVRAIALEANFVGWPLPTTIAKYRQKYSLSHGDYNQIVEFFANGGAAPL